LKETRKIEGVDFNGIWKNGPLDFKKYFKMNFSFSYCSHQCHFIHNKFPSDFLNNTKMITVKFVIITELIRSQNSIAVIFLMAEFWGFEHTFCHTQKTYYQREISVRTSTLYLTPNRGLEVKSVNSLSMYSSRA
jgi:hypothetical protein